MAAPGRDVTGRDGERLSSGEVGVGLDVEGGEGDAFGGDGDVVAGGGRETGGGEDIEECGAAANGCAVLGVGTELTGGEALSALAEFVGRAECGAVAV